jgi:putative ABC transport system permease protein
MLNLMLLRSLWRLRGQSLATALVVGAGVALYIMSIGALNSIEATRDAYYDRYRLATVFASAKRAPLSLTARIAAVPGVRAMLARVTGPVILDVPGFGEPVNGVAHSLADGNEIALNAVHLVRGRFPDPERPQEVLVSDAFARAHGLASGDPLGAILKGKGQELRIVGTALSPEHVFTIPPGNLTTDDRRFAILWLSRDSMEGAFDQQGAFNELLLLTDRTAPLPGVIQAVDRILAPYGGTGAYSRDELMSDKFLRAEMGQLATLARILPPLFMAVAAFLLWVMIGRVIDTDREEIGLLKAFGYRDREIGFHYAKLVVAISLVGVAIGCALGAWLGHGITGLYAQFYQFPFLVFRIDSGAYVAAVAISVGSALAGAASPVRRAVRLSPTVAMEPPAPTAYASRLQRAVGRLDRLDEPSRMILRHVLRWPGRTGFSILGIALAAGLCIASSFNIDAITRMLEFTFDYAARQDATLTFAEPRHESALADVGRLPGVIAFEPFRAVPVRLRHGLHERREALTGASAGASMNRLIDDRWRPVEIPPRGLVLTSALAERLGAGRGSRVRVEVLEGKRPVFDLPVVQVVRSYYGTAAYVDGGELSRLMEEGPLVSGAYLKIDPAREAELFRAVKQRPLIAGISFRSAVLHNFETQVKQNIGIFRLYNLALSAIIVLGVVYNNARLSFSERARELATMRVLGYRRREVSYILLGELVLLTLAALPLGAAIGLGFAYYIASAFSSDIYTIPYAVSLATIGLALSTVLVSAVASGLLVRRRIDRLDLNRVLKSRE